MIADLDILQKKHRSFCVIISLWPFQPTVTLSKDLPKEITVVNRQKGAMTWTIFHPKKSHQKTRCLLLQLFKFFLHRKPKNSVEFKLPRKMIHAFSRCFVGLLSKMERNIFPSHRSCQTQRGAVTIRMGATMFGGGNVELHLLSSLYVTSFRLRHEALVGHEKGLHAQMLSRVINKWQHNPEYTSFYSRKSSYSTDKLFQPCRRVDFGRSCEYQEGNIRISNICSSLLRLGESVFSTSLALGQNLQLPCYFSKTFCDHM